MTAKNALLRRIAFSLRLRLLLTNLLVMFVTLGASAGVAHIYKAQAFEEQVSETVLADPSKPSAEKADANFILAVFNQVNDEGTQIALAVSIASVGLLTWSLIETIDRPLRKIERSVRLFNNGNLNARIPPSGVPELHQLGLTLNSAATRLQGVEARRREVISDLAHELGTPLTVIQGYLELVSDGKLDLTPDVGEQLHREAERMGRLIDDMKTLSKVETGNLPLHLQAVDPKPLINGVVKALAVKKAQKEIQLEVDCPSALPDIFADPDRFQQVLINLVGNAIHYTEKGLVKVRGWSDPLQLWVEISDTGIGIAPEDLPHVFDRFWRSEASRRQNQKGSGIGLAITKHLVEVQGGSIEAESEPGKGTVFRLSLPLAETELQS